MERCRGVWDGERERGSEHERERHRDGHYWGMDEGVKKLAIRGSEGRIFINASDLILALRYTLLKPIAFLQSSITMLLCL